ALAFGAGRGTLERPVRDAPLRDPLAGIVADVDVAVDELLAAPEHARLRNDVLADGRREVAHGQIDRPRVVALRVADPGRGGEHASDADRRCRDAAVQRLPGIRVLVLVRDPEAGAVGVETLDHDAEARAVRGGGDAVDEHAVSY